MPEASPATDLANYTDDQLIDAFAEQIDKFADQQEEYYTDGEQFDWSDYASYARESAENKKPSELFGDVDDSSIEAMIEKLREFGASDDDIKDLLIETGEGEFNDSIYYSDDSLGVQGLGSEEETSISGDFVITIDKKNYHLVDVIKEMAKRNNIPEEEPEEDVNDHSKKDQTVDDEDIFKRAHKACNTYLHQDFFTRLLRDTSYPEAYITIGVGERMVEWIAQPIPFIKAAKRFIRDMKVLKKQGVDPAKFPAASSVLLAYLRRG